MAFDLLYYGKPLDGRKYRLRRRLLERLVANSSIGIVPSARVRSVKEALALFERAKGSGAEGIVLKTSTMPTKWIKYKGQMDSFDTMLLGAFYGKGKRESYFGAFLLGLGDNNHFVSFCKVGTGFTDELLGQASEMVLERRCNAQPDDVRVGSLKPDVWCIPRGPLWEISGQEVTKSPSHGAKLSLRFPRFVAFRNDKDECTSLQSAQRLFSGTA